MYAVSINKLVYNLVSTNLYKATGIMQLISSLDHALFVWLTEISFISNKTRKMLESYYKQFLLSVINKALYLKRQNFLPSAITELTNAIQLCEEVKCSNNSETVNICARFFLCLGVLHLEVKSVDDAQTYLLEGIKCLLQEQKFLIAPFSFLREHLLPSRQIKKLRKNFLILGSAIYNIALAYEIVKESREALESYRMCSWCYNVERSIFKSFPTMEAYKFMIKSSSEKESEITMNLKVDKELNNVGIGLVKPDVQLSVIKEENPESRIDSLWNPIGNHKESDKQIRKKNFTFILNLAQGNTKPVKPTNDNKARVYSSIATPTFRKETKKETNAFFITGINQQPITKLWQCATQSKKTWKEMISPNEFFKELVCSKMKIDSDWINKSNKKEKYGQDKIKKLMNTEKNAQRSLNILKNYLVTKSKDKTIKEPEDEQRDFINMFASNEVKHKVYTLNKNLADIIFDSQESTQRYDKTYPTYTTPRHKRVPTATLRENDEDEEQRIAEELQNEIERIERKIKSTGAWKNEEEDIDTVFTSIKKNSLANSVIKHKEYAAIKKLSKKIATKSLFHK